MNDDTKNKEKIKKDVDIAAVSYVPFICLIALYRRKDSDFVQFHARQGTVIFVLGIIVYIIGNLSSWLYILRTIFFILLLVSIVIGFSTALNGEIHKIPFISDLASIGFDYEKLKKSFKKEGKVSKNFFSRLINKKEEEGDKKDKNKETKTLHENIAEIEKEKTETKTKKIEKKPIMEKIKELEKEKK